MTTCYITHANTVIAAATAPTRHAARLAALFAVPGHLGYLPFRFCTFRYFPSVV